MVRNPPEARAFRVIKITHPDLRPGDRTHYSLEDLDRAKLLSEASAVDQDNPSSRDRALLKLVNQIMTLESLLQGRLLAIFPYPSGENRAWATPADIRTGTYPPEAAAALRRFEAGDYAGLPEQLRALNPSVYPSESRIETELRYNRVRPFHWASLAYFAAALAFLFAMVFGRGRAVPIVLTLAALALTTYGYALRWIIAGRYPLSNHYESMIACALGAGLFGLLLEIRFRYFTGLAGGLVAALLLVLANNVPAFAEQGFVAPLVPALQTVWMTIHVPIIMVGYATGMLLMVLGHLQLGRTIFARPDDGKLDKIMHRLVQLTVLFLLLGIILGAVWAGEAWGRPWGWDMKETWALITLLCYLAIQHARFLGVLRSFGTAVTSLAAFQVMILTYYGVNFVFGKGLHTYGFGAGEVWPLLAFFGAEAVFVAIAAMRHRGNGPVAETHDMPIPE
jgi:ABC-type transport system involved in cytochrome c biogenesis permease subunit